MRRHGEKAENSNLNEKSPRLRVSVSPRRVLIFLLSFFVVWIFTAPFLAEVLIVEKPLERADAIFVLGGSSAYLERTQKAAELYKNGRAPKIFLSNDGLQSGWNGALKRNPFFVEYAQWELIKQGVPAEAIEILPGIVESTHDEAVLLEKTLKEQNLKSILLVTSGYHTRRTLRTFEKVLLDNNDSIQIGIESPPAGWQTPKSSYWWLSARGWNFVAGEYLKIVYYWLFY
jgi:uncharacterized SAM-binding protein YcdF (DUF218 family)